MPKTFTSEERENIRRNLRDAARGLLRDLGVRKTTVDEIVKRAGVAKGTFYLFYQSKESLFLDLISHFKDEVEALYLDLLQELDENHIVTSLTDVFYRIAMKFYKDGIYVFLREGEIESIMIKSPSSVDRSILRLEKGMLSDLFSYFSIDDEEEISYFSSSYEALLYTFLHRDRIEDFESTLRYLIRGLVLQLVEA